MDVGESPLIGKVFVLPGPISIPVAVGEGEGEVIGVKSVLTEPRINGAPVVVPVNKAGIGLRMIAVLATGSEILSWETNIVVPVLLGGSTVLPVNGLTRTGVRVVLEVVVVHDRALV